MLRWIVRNSSIRLYDISSIIIFSASVNIITWGLTLKNNRLIYLFLLISSFSSLAYSGWCSYWLCKEVEQYIDRAMRIENAAVNEIKKDCMSFNFQIHFIFAICFFIMGVACFSLFVSSNKNV
ncbi:MAG: hypothetical protein Q7J76_02450 [Candidatus Brocadiaceae bacterium]|uniref:hypothetical protein n=1 Tax=Candidatus Wunengus sp. YC61 TaxID=3367698 RepID=UPI002720B8A6|nr:hypothetical protein [Candidatus Brocadiaceae bacterium]